MKEIIKLYVELHDSHLFDGYYDYDFDIDYVLNGDMYIITCVIKERDSWSNKLTTTFVKKEDMNKFMRDQNLDLLLK